MARRWPIGLAVGAVLVLLGVAIAFRDTTTPSEVTFTGVAGTEPGDPGIYTYRTEGFETVDALGGARHDYPESTVMVISTTACGVTVRWQAIEERWVEWEHCGSDLTVTATREFHEWFGVPDLESERCDDPRPILEDVDAVVCRAGEAIETYRVEVVGTEVLSAGGDAIEVVHVRRTSEVSGRSQGVATVDEWRVPGTALVVRYEAVTENVTASPVGDVTYREEVVLQLRDLEPTG
jgi:hypothetical protein